MSLTSHKKIIIYDGECGFCSFWVNFIHKNDKKNVFLFAANQSDFAQRFLSPNTDSIVLLENNQIFIKWKALIFIFTPLKFPYSLSALFLSFIPLAIGNKIYDFVAQNRYRFSRSCPIPEDSLRAKIYPWSL